jgi:tetratricopeptide (TPR) repeat protein
VLGALGGESRGAEALAGYEHAAAVYGGAEGVGFSSPLAEAALYTNWGAMLAGRTRHSEAADVLQKAVTLRPDDASAFLRLATELKATGSHAEELEAYDSALAVLAEGAGQAGADNGAGNGVMLAEAALAALLPKGGAGRGRASVEEIARLNRCVAFERLGRKEMALGCYEALVTKAPRYARAQANRGMVLYLLRGIYDIQRAVK